MTRALLSVSDKAGLVEFAAALVARGIDIISTGGTFKVLRAAGIAATEVKDVTGFPEIMDGRVKTLHPKIHGGLLADRDVSEHIVALSQHNITPIDLLVVNLYPFRETVSRPGADYAECVENIDIGGPAMIRAAAKNHKHVAVLTDPADYAHILAALDAGTINFNLRRDLAAKAYAHTAAYDAAIAVWFQTQMDAWPNEISFAGKLVSSLRYGENPHQAAALYANGENRPGVVTATQIQGKELSYNNINDTDAAYELVAEFARPAVAIIKHANPCGVAEGDNLLEAYELALRCDPVSAFGGIIAVNRELDVAAAAAMSKLFAEVIIAPNISDAAREVLKSKTNLRVLVAGVLPDIAAPGQFIKSVAGGLLVQSRDNGVLDPSTLQCATRRKPTDAEMGDLLFAWKVAKHVKSNAIVYVKDGATVGVGAGQMSRVDSARIAAHKAALASEKADLELLTRGSAVASDAFFPFADGLLTVIEAGATAVIQPGGSKRDAEVIAAADEHNIAMLFTGMRHFRH